MNDLNWVQKWSAIKALCPNAALTSRDDGSWYVINHRVERREGGCLSGGHQSGEEPIEAIRELWEWMSEPGYYLVLNALGSDRKAVRWNGFMWVDVDESVAR